MAEGSTLLDALTAELLGDVGRLHDEVKALSNALPGAAQEVRQAGSSAAEALNTSVAKAVEELAKRGAEVEVSRHQAAFLVAAEKVIQDIRSEATTAAPSAWKIKVALAMSLVVLVSALAGGVLGATFSGRQTLTSDQARKIAAGEDFIRIIPTLDDATRAKLNAAIEKTKGDK